MVSPGSQRREQFDHLAARDASRLPAMISAAHAADFQPAGVHRGQLARQAVQQFHPVEPGQADLARHVDALVAGSTASPPAPIMSLE